MVSMLTVATCPTCKFSLTATVGMFNVSAFRAALAGVGGIDQDNRDACLFRLVSQEVSQLCKRPIAVFSALLFARNPGPLANMRQVF